MSINHTQKHASLTSPDSDVRYNRQPAIFDGLLLDKVQLMKQNNESITPLRKYIAIGYALIALLIGGIVFIYLGEWRELERIEAESKEVNMLRQKVHDAYAQMLDLTLYGEKVLEWNAVKEYLQLNIRYPKECVENRIEGKAFVRFSVEKNGKIKKVELARSSGVGNIWERYGIRGAGEVFLVDRDGTILAIGITAEEIERILKEKL